MLCLEVRSKEASPQALQGRMSCVLLACPAEPKSFRNFSLCPCVKSVQTVTERCSRALPLSPSLLASQRGSVSRDDFEYSEPPRGTQLGTEHPFHPRSLSPSLALYYTPSASFALRKPDVFKEEGTQSFQNTTETGLPDW